MLKDMEKVDDMIDSGADDIKASNFKEMAKKMRAKYDKYDGDPAKMNALVYMAVIFYPRYKLFGLELSLCDMFGEFEGLALTSKVKKAAEALFDEYWQYYKPVTPRIGGQSDVGSSDDGKSAIDEVDGQFFAKNIEAKMKSMKSGGRRLVRTEFQRYLNEEDQEERNGKFDVLAWWRVHSLRFPVVARMTRDILAVTVSTVASESVFSTGGRHLDSFRSSLSPKMVQALICAQNWFKVKEAQKTVEEELYELKFVEKGIEDMGLNDNVIDMVDFLNT